MALVCCDDACLALAAFTREIGVAILLLVTTSFADGVKGLSLSVDNDSPDSDTRDVVAYDPVAWSSCLLFFKTGLSAAWPALRLDDVNAG